MSKQTKKQNATKVNSQEGLTCKYCGKTGFKGTKGLASHRKFSKSCFDSWKKEMVELDNIRTKVKCEICGKLLRNISNTHLKTHNMTQKEYKDLYPDSNIFSDGLLKIQRDRRESTIYKIYGRSKDYCKQDLASFIKRYGDEKGKEKYNKYRSKIGISAAKYIDKFGYELGLQKYDEMRLKLKGKNTLPNLIEKYGLEIGTKRYGEFVEAQRKGRSIDRYKEKYGDDLGVFIFKNMCKRKGFTLENYIAKYGEADGRMLYEAKRGAMQAKSSSNVSNEFFLKVKALFHDEEMYFSGNPQEFGCYAHEINQYCFLDFYMPKRNKVIEFYGNYWHANPAMYQSEQLIRYPKQKAKTAKEVQDTDAARINALKAEFGFDILIVWELDYNTKEEGVMETVKRFINGS